jgi:tape measure domain-containing protein
MSDILRPEDLFDFDSYENRIREMMQLNAQFEKTSTSMVGHISEAQKPLLEQLKKYIELVEKVNVAQGKGVDSLRDYEKESNEVGNAVERTRRLENLLKDSYDASTKSINQLKYGLDVLKEEYNKLKPTQTDYKTQQEAIAARAKELRAAIDSQTSALKSANTVVKSVEGSYSALSKQTNELRNRLKNLPDAFDKTTGAINKTNHEAVELQRIIQQNDRVLKNFDASLGNHQRNVGNYSGALLGAGKSLGSFGLALFGLDSALAVTEKLFSLIAEFSRLDTALKNVTKSTEEYYNALAFVEAIANKNGQNIQVLTRNYMALTAASRGTALEGIETQKIFLAVTNAAAALQMTNEDLEGALNAVAQMMSKGSIQAEELRGQLGERLYGAFNDMAKAIGVSTAQLNDMLKQGKVTVDMLSKFADVLNDKFGDKAKNNLDTLNGSWEYMKTQLSLIVKILSETSGIQNFFSKLTTGLGDTFKAVKILVQSEEWSKLTSFLMAKTLGLNTSIVKETEEKVDNEKFLENSYLYYVSSGAKERMRILKDEKLALKSLEDELKKAQDIKDGYGWGSQVWDRSAMKKADDNVKDATKRVNLYKELINKLEGAPAITNITSPPGSDDKSKEKELTEIEKIEAAISKLNVQLENEVALSLQGRKLDEEKLQNLLSQIGAKKALLENIKEELAILQAQKQLNVPAQTLNPIGKLTIAPGKQKDLRASYGSTIGFSQQADGIAARALDRLQDASGYRNILQIERDAFLELEDLKLKTTDKRQKERLDIIKKYLNLEFEETKSKERRKEELLQRSFEVGSQLAAASFQFLSSLRDNDIQSLELQKEHELELVGNNADAKAAVEKKYASEILEIKRKQARLEKAQAAFNIGINTAQAIVRFLADPGGVPGVVLSVAAGVVGALQLATVLAKPLPQFFKGTDNAPEGFALVAEKGPELRESKGKAYYYDKPQITWLNQGDKIHTAEQTAKILAQNQVNQELANAASQTRLLELRYISQHNYSPVDTKSIEKAIKDGIAQMPHNIIQVDNEGFHQYTKSKNAKTDYNKKRFSLPK